MPKKIYVGNLSYSVDDQELENLFSAHGTVTSARVIIDRYDNRSKGFGFVEMEDDAAALAAIEALNGSDQGGRELKVSEARERNDRPRRDY
ncbi:MAG: RNA-binding protein [Spirochaetes bacterium]|nr:MAG: RNA-binding protein [Spirochaetota bacterium]RKX77730.1 MAG: RNA-binding protein [Spirochaetota bacterium]RKX89181.1 MAG: RNA-binding protein [Spirochaetota bacterium]RKX98802.1 MAG: RNA-binding protein [Spirochaetota bacterium]